MSVSAQSTSVIVRVRRDGQPADATVWLRDANGSTEQCATRGGTCRIVQLRGGRYTVWARDAEGRQSQERLVMLPETGEVTLVVAAPD